MKKLNVQIYTGGESPQGQLDVYISALESF